MKSIIAILQLAVLVNADTIPIIVGSGLIFSPSSVTADVGDVLEFRFNTGGHAVASSTLDTPCAPGSPAFYSGFVSGDSSESVAFLVTVNDTEPMYFYCPKGSHCKGGMVGVINPATSSDLAAYKSAAAAAASVVTPSVVEGGTITTLAAASAT